jgi:hypothetical protein
MSYFSDSLDFEKFFAKDLWKNVKKDPKRLVLGVDPASTWAWNKVLGRDDDPLVDQMGGPYDGRVVSFGHGNGGVYDRAQAAGIDTRAAAGNHDAAHLIAGSYAVGGLGNVGGNVFGGGGEGAAQPGLWDQGFAGKTNFQTGMPSTSTAGTAGIPGIAGPVGGGTGASSAANMSGMQWAKLGMGLANSGQPQQQQQPPPQAPVSNMAQPSQVPTMGQKISGGLGRVGAALFPVDPNTGMTADQIKQLRTNAMMQMGLGMLGASSKGQGFGASLAAGYGLAQGNIQGSMQQAYENAMANRAETRAVDREKRLDEQADRAQKHQEWLETHTLDRETVADERYAGEREYKLEQDRLAQDRWKTEQGAMEKWRADQINARSRGDVPAGYRLKPDGNLEAIPGGPADPSGLAARKGAQSLRKEFRNLQTVKDYEAVWPLLDSVQRAPDTPQGDLQVIYTVGKVLDPGSVVREGELQLTQNAAPWLQKALGEVRAQMGQGGRLTPEMRKGLVDALQERVSSYKTAYDRDFQQYTEYASENSLDPKLVVGTPMETAASGGGLGQPGATPAAPVRVNSPDEAMRLPPGTVFITPDGRRKVR